MLKNYLKTALRALQRNKVYSLINILGLSLGLASAMLIILYVKDEISYDRFHKQAGQIYRIGFKNFKPDGSLNFTAGATGYLQGPRFSAAIPEIKTFLRISSTQKDIRTGTEVKSQDFHLVDTSFFSVFSFPLLSGNPKTALKEPHSVVISEDLAKQQFGTTNALGRTIMIKDDSDRFVPYAVTGVAKRCPQNSSIKFDILLPLVVNKEDETRQENWFSSFLNTFVVLNPGAKLNAVEAKMQKTYEADAKEEIKFIAEKFGDSTTTHYTLQALADMHLSLAYGAYGNGLTDGSKPIYSYILSGIALFILLIACINFINLTVARSLKRTKEIGIRKVVGGNRKQLIEQFLGESFILCLVAFILAILWVQLVLPVFNDLSNKALAISYLFDVKLVSGYIGLFIITSLLAGFYPAWVLSGYDPVQTLYSRFKLAGKNYLQKGLVVLQFSMASFLIICTITIYSQFNFLTNEKLGYDDTNVVTVNMNSGRTTRNEDKLLREDLMKSPAIEDVAFRNSGGWGTEAKVNGETKIGFDYETIDESYLPLLKIPVIRGRNFSKDFPSDSIHTVLVNESFAKKAGWRDPIGKQVEFFSGEKYTVIGLVKDYHDEPLTSEIAPLLFTMKAKNPYGEAFIKLRPHNETAGLKFIESSIKKIFPTSPYSYSFKNDENLKNYEAEARWKKIMMFGAALTIFISCIGLFGLSVLSAEKRIKEVGIRKVLGASVSGVVTLLSKDFLKLVILSLLIAVPVSWLAASKWLENYPYRISLSWWMFAAAALLVAFISLATVSYHAIKAAMANPASSLRTE